LQMVFCVKPSAFYTRKAAQQALHYATLRSG
jgi:hypothetical protein